MGIGSLFRTEAYYDYNPGRGLKFYERQSFSFNIMFSGFRFVVYCTLVLLSLATAIAVFNRRWQFFVEQAVPSLAILAVFLIADQFMAKYRAYLSERTHKMRELMKSGEMDDGNFRPEDVDWT